MSAYVRKKRIYGSQRALPPLDVLASRPAVRILRYLAAHAGEHTGRQVGRSTGVAPSRAAEALSKLVNMGVLQRRAAGRAYLYSLNETNYLVRDVLLPAFRGEARWLEALGNEVLTTLNRIADSVLLYGSWARGQATPASDVDLLVVSRTRQGKVQAERLLESQRGQLAERFGHPISLLVITRHELLKRLRRGDRLIKDVIREGRVLAGKSIAEVVGG